MGLLDAARRRLRPGAKQSENADARRRVLEMLPSRSTGAEVGVWKGDFSALLLNHLRPVRLHLIDPWSFRSDLPRAWYGGAAATSQREMDAIYDGVRARFAQSIAEGVVQIHRATSAQAAAELEPAELDWVYIDGDHRYETVRDELDRFGLLVKPGGIVAGDDYHGGGWWQGGVKRAVDEWAPNAGLEELTIIGSQFFARLPA